VCSIILDSQLLTDDYHENFPKQLAGAEMMIVTCYLFLTAILPYL
jgi:hypothetical protein